MAKSQHLVPSAEGACLRRVAVYRLDQKEVNHAGDGVGAVHRRGAVLQDVDVIDHGKRNQVNVHASAESDGVQRTKGDTFSVNEHQGFFGQQAAQVELDGAVPASATV